MLTHSCDHLILTTLENKPQIDRVTHIRTGENFLPILLQILQSVKFI